MPRVFLSIFFAGVLPSLAMSQNPPAEDRSWITKSNSYTQQLIDVSNRHSPEQASAEGLSAYDTKISVLTQADEDQERAETEVVLKRLKASLQTEKDPRVLEDIHILIQDTNLPQRK